MKRSSLTKTQQQILETLLARHGLIVTSSQVAQALGHLSAQSQRRFVSTLVESGWLVRIKKGLYQIATIGALGTLTLSRLTIAQLLAPQSYVSFQAALQQHGLFDQGLAGIGSIALRRHSPVALEGTTYAYVTTQTRYFFGFEEKPLDGLGVRIAKAEKAILDLLQFKRTQATVDLVLELLREEAHNIDLEQLISFARKLPTAVQQSIGFLIETAGVPPVAQLNELAQGSGVAWLTPQSTVYNRRWRIYIDPYFTAR